MVRHDRNLYRPRALVIEPDRLMGLAIQDFLSLAFDVRLCASLKEAHPYLEDSQVELILCGGAHVHRDCMAIRRAVCHARVIALLNRNDSALAPAGVNAIRKPFVSLHLNHLLLGDSRMSRN